MSDFDDLINELKQKRDELRLQIHLAQKAVRDAWEGLEQKMDEFSGKAKRFADDAKLKETGEGVGEALVKVEHELKLGYERVKNALKT